MYSFSVVIFFAKNKVQISCQVIKLTFWQIVVSYNKSLRGNVEEEKKDKKLGQPFGCPKYLSSCKMM